MLTMMPAQCSPNLLSTVSKPPCSNPSSEGASYRQQQKPTLASLTAEHHSNNER
jgi:hypothetical protein